MSARRLIAATVACASTAACALLLNLEPPPAPDDGGADVVTDAGPRDASGKCVALDAALPGDDADTEFRALAQVTVDDAGLRSWTFFDTTTLNAAATGFEGGTFDGRYVYFAPNAGGVITRYDTTKSSAGFSKTGWFTFDPALLGIDKQGFSGATFDGRYVYFVPLRDVTDGGSSGLVVRYDSTAAFAATTSWTTFDTSTIPVSDGGVPARGFSGGVFDGRAMYFVPNFDGVAHDGRAARYDTAYDAGNGGDASGSTFTNANAWSTFDTSSASGSASALGFVGGAFDGKTIYLSPSVNGVTSSTGGANPFVSHYDTTLPFASAGSWGSFQVDKVNASAYGFAGSAFDGHFVYFVPHASTTFARFDITKVIDNSGAWTMFDVSTLIPANDAGAPVFAGGAFDGRFIYLVPSAPAFGVVVRYDTLSPMTSSCAWSTLDLTHLDAVATNFFGAVYDGRYLYLIPRGSTVARFDTKSPSSMPLLPAFNGSFF